MNINDKYHMETSWKNAAELIEYPAGGVISRVLLKTDRSDATLFCLAKGTDISEHTSTRAGFVYVIEGKGVFNLAGEDIIMKPGVIIFMAENAVHSLKADDNTSFILALS